MKQRSQTPTARWRALRLAAALPMALAGLTVLATPAQAVTLVSNTGQTDAGHNYRVRAGSTSYAQEFTTGTNPDGYTLSEVVVNIREGVVATPAFSIHTSRSGRPDTNVVNLTGSVSSAGLQSFVPASATTLTPSTEYFVVFSNSGGDKIPLEGTISEDEDLGAAVGWSIANNYLRTSGSSWRSYVRSMEIAIKGMVVQTTTNAAPTASNGTVTTNEDTDYTFAAANFNFADTDSGAALSSVKIVTLPATGRGKLKLDGSAIALADLPQTVTTPDLDAGRLTYTPPANANGSGYASFTFKVNDGADDSASAYTLTIDVTASTEPATGAFISNTGQTKVATDYRVNRSTSLAQQFTTGTNPGGYTLSEVVVSIWRGGVATPAFSIHTSSDTNLPDTNVVNLTGSVSSAGLQSFVPASVTTLTPSTKYFVVFSRGQDQHSSGSYFLLEATASNNHDLGAAAGWSIANSFLRLQNGTWGSHGRSMKIAIKGTVQTTSPDFSPQHRIRPHLVV